MPLPFDITPLPLKTDRTLRTVPYVTYAILFLCLCIYFSTLALSPYALERTIITWGFAINTPSLWTLFSSAFVHTDLFHLLGNLLILWLVGTVLESGIGSLLFALLYLTSLVVAVVLHGLIGWLFYPESLGIHLIGASGAIAGVTGFAAFRYYHIRVYTLWLCAFRWLPIPLPFPLPVWVPLWLYAVIFAGREVWAGLSEVITGEHSNVAHWAHIGGLALGALTAKLLNVVSEGRRESVIETSAKATSGTAPRERSVREVEALLLAHPTDPELLEALAALTLVDGDAPRSRDLYLQAIGHFLTAHQADRAAVGYLNIVHAFPDTLLGPREQMAIASALEEGRHYPEALHAFTQVWEHYPDRDEAHTALIRAAQLAQRHLHAPEQAVTLLQTLLTHYPDTPWRHLAVQRLKHLGPV
jgi:membrane associated rhomboid family serine protease